MSAVDPVAAAGREVTRLVAAIDALEGRRGSDPELDQEEAETDALVEAEAREVDALIATRGNRDLAALKLRLLLQRLQEKCPPGTLDAYPDNYRDYRLEESALADLSVN